VSLLYHFIFQFFLYFVFLYDAVFMFFIYLSVFLLMIWRFNFTQQIISESAVKF